MKKHWSAKVSRLAIKVERASMVTSSASDGFFFRDTVTVTGTGEDLRNYDIRQMILSSSVWQKWDGSGKMSRADVLAEWPGSDPLSIDTDGTWVKDTAWDWQAVRQNGIYDDNQLYAVTYKEVQGVKEVRQAAHTRDFRIEVRNHATNEIVAVCTWGYSWNNNMSNWVPPSPGNDTCAHYVQSPNYSVRGGTIEKVHGIENLP